ncbi:MAG: acetate/propionate family kinase [Actinomycetota bacterium]
MRVLVVNSGSSSIKLRLLDADDATVLADDLGTRGLKDPGALGQLEGRDIDAVGHRVVHGGRRFQRPAVITDEVEEEIASLTELAPLHQPAALEAIAVVRKALPEVPHVACFDTSFHSGMPDAVSTYAIPLPWRESFGVRRYGFHGLSHAYASRRAAQMMSRPLKEVRIVTCHLGAGASLTAVKDGLSVDTTMGFTPLEGLVMATRSGSIDPSIPLWLQTQRGLTAAEVEEGLELHSGLTGLAGSADMRAILSRAADDDGDAVLAREVYAHALRAGIARMAAAMGGMDAVVFTGGVGERSPEIRSLAARGLEFLGLRLDDARNRGAAGDADISQEGAPVRALVVAAREDLEIARETRTLLQRED